MVYTVTTWLATLARVVWIGGIWGVYMVIYGLYMVLYPYIWSLHRGVDNALLSEAH